MLPLVVLGSERFGAVDFPRYLVALNVAFSPKGEVIEGGRQ